MAGIYLHIPFCRHKCGYCNFFSVASLKRKEEVLDAIVSELELMAPGFADLEITTLYWGGGTPSMLLPHEIEKVMRLLQRAFPRFAPQEVTLEANPDDVNADQLKAWINMGFNRISLGIQSFNLSNLLYLDRKHNPVTALKALELVANAPLQSFSADLIYAIPGQSPEHFLSDLERCAEFQVPHLSCYSLTVEPGTPLEQHIRKQKRQAPDEELFMEHWQILTAFAAQQSYNHYETSNLCLGVQYAQHNLNYWNHVPYLGLGPSAHSFLGRRRWWNPSSVNTYVQTIQTGHPPVQEEILSDTDLINEHVMTRLRTKWGIQYDGFIRQFGDQQWLQLLQRADALILSDWLEITEGHLRITPTGKPLENHLMAVLFAENTAP